MWYLETGNISFGCGSADFVKVYNLAKSIKTEGRELVYVKFYLYPTAPKQKNSFYRIGIVSDIEVKEATRMCRVGNKRYHLHLLDIISPLLFEPKGQLEYFVLSKGYLDDAKDKFLGFIFNDPEKTQIIHNVLLENSKNLLRSCF